MLNGKVHVLFLDTPYKFNMEATYGQKLRLLSENFAGSVLTSGEVGEFPFGDFVVRSVPYVASKAKTFKSTLGRALKYVRASREESRPVDVIITYDALNTGLLGLIVSRLCAVPLIVELNGDYSAWSNYAEISNPTKRRIKRALYMRLAAFVINRAKGVKLLFSSQLAPYKAKLKGMRTVRTFPNFLDVSAFRDLGETNTVAIIGFPFAVKGIDIAVAAFKEVVSEFPEWRMDVLGWYPGREKEKLDACIAGHPKINHHPPVSRDGMATYMGTCGIVVCASRTEGFPRVIKEAMQAGKPCIVSDVGGLPDAIQNGVNGLIFTSEDAVALAKCLRTLMGDKQLRSRLGHAAREFAIREYSAAAYGAYFKQFVLDTLSAAEARA